MRLSRDEVAARRQVLTHNVLHDVYICVGIRIIAIGEETLEEKNVKTCMSIQGI